MAAATSLYVGDLAPEVSEADLHSTFSALAHVASVRVCRDATTRASLRYGYVNFNRPEDAELVLQQMPEPMICNRRCRVMRNQRDLVQKKNAANLHVRDLAPSVTSTTLRAHFAPFGKIASCKVSSDANGKPLGYGFVLFEREEDANEALAKLDKSELENKRITVEKYKPRDEREATGARFTNVYVRPALSKDKLETLFSQYGTITSVFIGQNHACVNFQEHEQAAEAVEKLNGQDYDGVKLYVSKAKSKEELAKAFKQRSTTKSNLYVKNLADDIDDQKLTEEFSKFGTIVSAVVQRDSQGNSRGFGYVLFSNPDEARECIKAMHGRMVHSKPLHVCFHQSKSARQQENQQRFGQITPPQAPGPIYPPMYPPYPFLMHPPFFPRPGPPPFGPYPPAVMRRGPAVPPVQQPQPQPQAPVQRRGPDTDKQSIGEKLYPAIAKFNKEKAGKITGMLLEMEVEDLRPLLRDNALLQEKVNEAIQVLREAGQ